jgi:hypothetical protein
MEDLLLAHCFGEDTNFAEDGDHENGISERGLTPWLLVIPLLIRSHPFCVVRPLIIPSNWLWLNPAASFKIDTHCCRQNQKITPYRPYGTTSVAQGSSEPPTFPMQIGTRQPSERQG